MKNHLITTLLVLFFSGIIYLMLLAGKVVYAGFVKPSMEEQRKEMAIKRSLPDRVTALEQELAKLKSEKPALIEKP